MLDIHAFDRADSLRKRERLGCAERGRGDPVRTRAIPFDRRIETLLDGGPDREDRGKGVAGDVEVAAVPDVHLVDLVEQVLRGVPGEDIGQTGIHPHPQHGEPAGSLPLRGAGELFVGELDAGEVMGIGGMRPREAGGHVHVVDPGRQGAVEDRHHEAGIDRVHHQVDTMPARQLGHPVGVSGVQLLDREAAGVAEQSLQGCRPRKVVIGEDQRLAPVARGAHAGDRLANRADAHQQNSHVRNLVSQRSGARRRAGSPAVRPGAACTRRTTPRRTR